MCITREKRGGERRKEQGGERLGMRRELKARYWAHLDRCLVNEDREGKGEREKLKTAKREESELPQLVLTCMSGYCLLSLPLSTCVKEMTSGQV